MGKGVTMADRYVRVSDYPELAYLCWQRERDARITEADALAIYERNWRHVGPLTDRERRFVHHLVDAYGNGVLLV
ncbi:hypothetical protein [Tomitella gaofuii]|uniref:hypothetical protein n=1 Tax=Tomitella gaofuii TaxID=2760083 RepID=UPI001C70B450|nr:hypothetical protein [Tomitella gaofuii]